MSSYYLAKGTRAEARELALTQVQNLNDAQWIVFPGTNGEMLPLVVHDLRHTDQGLTAASDLLFHKRFDDERTTVGLHVKTAAATDEFITNAGMLHVNYGGKSPRFAANLDFMGWNGLDLLNGVLVPTLLKDERTTEEKIARKQPSNVLAAYKHSYIDGILKGRTLVVFIGHYNRNGEGNKYVAKFIDQWAKISEGDTEEALALRNAAIQGRSDNINIVQPIMREAATKAKANGSPKIAAPVVNAETGEVAPTEPQKLMISVVGRKTQKNLFDVPAGSYAMAQNGRLIGAEPIPWDPTDANTVFVWEGIAEGGFEVDLG